MLLNNFMINANNLEVTYWIVQTQVDILLWWLKPMFLKKN